MKITFKRMIKNIILTLILLISMCFYIYVIDYLNDLGKIVAFIIFFAIIIVWGIFCDWSKIFRINND